MTGTNIVLPAILKAKYSTPRTLTLWGQEYKNRVPEVIEEKLGDGLQLIGFEPMMTRPDYYVLFVDSGWDTNNGADDPVCDHIEEICMVIEDQCGQAHETYEDSLGRTRRKRNHWPALSWDGGQWWQIRMFSRV